MRFPRVLAVGDAAATIELGREVEPAAVGLAADLLGDPPPWLQDATPTLAGVLVVYDPAATTWTEVQAVLLARAVASPEAPPNEPREVVLPARYDGPDLDEVARAARLATDEVVALHTSVTYRVQMVGFLPGFAYLGPLPEALRLPRRSTPRVRVPARSIAIADSFTGVYPSASPGGWHLIGSVDVDILDLHEEPLALLAPGDLVRFAP